MKIGILTHHYIKNYGAFLQTYALQETLKKNYPNDEVFVINYINRKHLFINTLGWFRFNIKREKIKKYFQKIQVPFVFKKFEKKYFNMTRKIYDVKKINNMNFDVIIIGSDEVWNYSDTKSFDSIKFGDKLTCKNIITYAPSMGNSNLNEVPISVLKSIKNISSFSSRDNRTELFINNVLKKKCTRVLDPTFLFSFPSYSSDLINRLKNEKYILMYYCDKLPDNMREFIKHFAKKNDLKIYGAGEYQKWFDDIKINVNPFEWIEMFKNAEIIFTGTFHGTVFSIKERKPFYNYIGNSCRLEKINSLLSELKIQNRSIDEDTNIDFNLDYNSIYITINKKINSSLEYLKKNISE